MTARRPKLDSALLIAAMLAGIGAILMPLLVFAPIFEPKVSEGVLGHTGGVRFNALEAGHVGEIVAATLPATVAGGLALAGLYLLTRGRRTGRPLMGIGAAALLVLSVLTAGSIGFYVFPMAFFLILAALWLPAGEH